MGLKDILQGLRPAFIAAHESARQASIVKYNRGFFKAVLASFLLKELPGKHIVTKNVVERHPPRAEVCFSWLPMSLPGKHSTTGV